MQPQVYLEVLWRRVRLCRAAGHTRTITNVERQVAEHTEGIERGTLGTEQSEGIEQENPPVGPITERGEGIEVDSSRHAEPLAVQIEATEHEALGTGQPEGIKQEDSLVGPIAEHVEGFEVDGKGHVFDPLQAWV